MHLSGSHPSTSPSCIRPVTQTHGPYRPMWRRRGGGRRDGLAQPLRRDLQILFLFLSVSFVPSLFFSDCDSTNTSGNSGCLSPSSHTTFNYYNTHRSSSSEGPRVECHFLAPVNMPNHAGGEEIRSIILLPQIGGVFVESSNNINIQGLHSPGDRHLTRTTQRRRRPCYISTYYGEATCATGPEAACSMATAQLVIVTIQTDSAVRMVLPQHAPLSYFRLRILDEAFSRYCFL